MAKPKIFISCGELSGESHAARVVVEILKREPEAEIRAFGSELLEELGVKLIKDYRQYGFSGISEVIANIKTILSLKDEIAEELSKWKPDLVLLVDYGGFNLQLAKALKKQNPSIKIIEYIAPQLWASRPWRINQIKKSVDKVLCTLPLEEKLYSKSGIDYRYVGNPVIDSLAKPITKEEFLEQFDKILINKGLNVIASEASVIARSESAILTSLRSSGQAAQSHSEILIGLFPGSRKTEIKEMLPLMIKASNELIKRNPQLNFRFVLAKAPTIGKTLLNKCGLKSALEMALENKTSHHIEILEADDMLAANHKLLSAADALWLCSGTVTLEAALYTTPYFLSYRSNLFNYTLYLIFRTINMAGLANIIAGKYIVKEFLQYGANSKNFIQETEAWLYDQPTEKARAKNFSSYYQQIKSDLSELKSKLDGYDTAKLVAEEVLSKI